MGEIHPENLRVVCEGLKTLDPTLQAQALFDCVQTLRRILSDPAPPLNEVIQTGSISYLVGCLKCSDKSLLYESAWAITNLVAGKNPAPTNSVVESGGIPALTALLQSDNRAIRNQAMWALSNIAANASVHRNHILCAGALPPIVTLIEEALRKPCQLDLLRLGVWTLSNFCRCKPYYPDFALICPAFFCFASVLERTSDIEVAESICWALSDLTSTHLGQNALIASLCLPRLVEKLELPPPTHLNAFKIFGNLVSGNSVQTNAVLSTDFLRVADRRLARAPGDSLLKEICYIISNISVTSTAELWNYNFIQNFFDYLDIPSLRLDIKKELMHALHNTIEKCNETQIQTIVNTYNAIQRFSRILDTETDTLVVELTLSLVHFLLRKNKYYADLMEKEGGFDTIENIIQKGGEHSARAASLRARHFQTVMARRFLRHTLEAYQNEVLPTVIAGLIVSFTYSSLSDLHSSSQ